MKSNDLKQITALLPIKWLDEVVNPYLIKINEDKVLKMTRKELIYRALDEYIKRHPIKNN